MKEITGKRSLPYSRRAVFHEGLNSPHWEYKEGGFCISPKSERIAKGGEVDIAIKIAVVCVSFTAIVTECMQDKHVKVEGIAPGFGDMGLAIDLEDDKKPNTTEAYYALGISLNQVNRLARLAIEKPLYTQLEKEMNPFIDQLAAGVSEAIETSKAIDLRLAS
jgi:hypothetical protein